jgi:hypothetical protein
MKPKSKGLRARPPSLRGRNDRARPTESQSPAIRVECDPKWVGRWPGWLVLCAGMLVPQFLLLGPALIGRTVDLPVDLLAVPNVDYFPNRPEYQKVVPRHGNDLLDLLLIGPATVGNFAAKEFRAGRLPIWQPSNFAGAPFVAVYSPFAIPYYLAPYPITLAWIALLQSVTVGLGMWFLLRRSFQLSYWPAAVGAWCAPLTGFMTVWHGFSPIGPYCWLPWSLCAAHTAVKNPQGFGSIALAVLTALILLSGHPGVGGLVLLTIGLYVVWLIVDDIRFGQRWQGAAWCFSRIGVAWVVGFLLSAPYLIPLLDYGRTGARMELQSQQVEERPPEGLRALPAILLPDLYGGNVRADWLRTARTVLPESSSGGYAGLLAALWLAPLAWCDRKRRSQVMFLSVLVIVSLGWTLNIPGIVNILRSEPLRPLASLSYNRWVLATSIAIVILAAIGLEYLRAAIPNLRWWFLIPGLVAAGFGGWCLYQRLTLRDAKQEQLFSLCYDAGFGLSLAALVGWAATIRAVPYGKLIRLGIVALLPLEMFWFAWSERRQADMSLYFPRIPVLDKLSALPAGRIWGVNCFPPNLNLTQGLEDIRGYDAVDPLRFVKLFGLAVDPKQSRFHPYAMTQYAVPSARHTAAGVSLHPVADLLNVRYLIFRDRPPAGLPVILHEDGYWIVENRDALPRAYVPHSVRVVKDENQALSQMASLDFDPRRTAFMTDDLRLPEGIQGSASVTHEIPTRAELEIEMQTAGLVVLSDLWDPGWHAALDGATCPIYRVDVALRGFLVPPGKHHIVCAYDPASVRAGWHRALVGILILLSWVTWKGLKSMSTRFHQHGTDLNAGGEVSVWAGN